MHPFLRAIGFDTAHTSEREIELLLDNLFHTYDHRNAIKNEGGNTAYVEFKKSFGPNIGICLCGELDGYGFHRTFYFPYIAGSGQASAENVSVDVRSGGDGYLGILDEGKIGFSLIFYVQNPCQIKKESFHNILRSGTTKTTLSALALSGTILFPIMPPRPGDLEDKKAYYQHHESLMAAAKNGNPEAMQSLTMEDMDIYAMLSRRIQKEDVYSIVESSFMPLGMESDQYQITGMISFCARVRNTLTKEYLYQMTVECNGLTFDTCINQRDLTGDPDVGRRFKGSIWLQGRVDFA